MAQHLGARFHAEPIDDIRTQVSSAVESISGTALTSITKQNIQARIRGVLLMALANNHQALLLTTGNKSELAMGYATLYGDMCGGLNIIGDLFKTDVYGVGAHINASKSVIPESIDREPSAELDLNQRDSDTLPEYHQLDQVLDQIMIQKIP